MQTTLPEVFAAGDCVETYHRLLRSPTYVPLGTTAHKQGKVAGENAVGGDRLFEGSLETQVVKVFDLAAARTGLRDDEALAGSDSLTVGSVAFGYKVYYPRPTNSRRGSRGTGGPDACSARRSSGTATLRWPSGSTSRRSPCSRGCRSMT